MTMIQFKCWVRIPQELLWMTLNIQHSESKDLRKLDPSQMTVYRKLSLPLLRGYQCFFVQKPCAQWQGTDNTSKESRVFKVKERRKI